MPYLVLFFLSFLSNEFAIDRIVYGPVAYLFDNVECCCVYAQQLILTCQVDASVCVHKQIVEIVEIPVGQIEFDLDLLTVLLVL